MPKKIVKPTTDKTKKEEIKKVTKKIVKKVAKKTGDKKASKTRYIEAVGRRKTAVARIRIWHNEKKEILVNDNDYKKYFPSLEMQRTILSPLAVVGDESEFRISIKVKGSGKHSQAGAIRHALSRALIKFNPEFRKQLKQEGFLTRDPRMRERKKFGLKRARKSPQWSKR
jgi:small subunit ribosomal protein S9